MEEQANTQWGAKQDGLTVVAENVKPVRQFKTKTYKGVVMYDNEIEEIEKMDIRDDDVWVCSFPRSGNTQSNRGLFWEGSDSFAILGLWVLGLAVPHINESNCNLTSPKHYFNDKSAILLHPGTH